MKIALAQTKNSLGNFKENALQFLSLIKQAENKADLILFPEGGLFSYPPKDFLFREDFFQLQEKELKHIHQKIPKNLGVLLPAFVKHSGCLYNGVFLLEKNKKSKFFTKAFLPNDSIFYESRYFQTGDLEDNVFSWKNKKIQILICEDLWQVKTLKKPDLFLCMNSSPYTNQKQKSRLEKAEALSKKYKCPFFYLNRVGAQDEIIFDGGSFILDKKGSVKWQGNFFKTDFTIYDLNKNYKPLKNIFPSKEEQQLQALLLGIKDFCQQLNFSKVHIGLSGGIDSALVLYLSLKALGKKNVKAFFLPSPFTDKISYTLTKELTDHLQVPLKTIDISPLYKKTLQMLFPNNSPHNPVSSQNVQARIRSLILMAESNETSSLLLGTSNKSELATGYSTLYGDLCGALLPLGDLWKTEVYNLVNFINKKEFVFSKKLILRPPTAELAPQQTDESQLLPYKELDTILKKLLQCNPPKTPKEKKIARLLQQSEFKRKQSPPILKLSETSFGEGRRMPIAHKFPL